MSEEKTAAWFRNGALDGASNAPTLECLIERGGRHYALCVALSGQYSPFRGVTTDEAEIARRRAFAVELLHRSVRATDWLLEHENAETPVWVQEVGDGGGYMISHDLRAHVPIGWGYLIPGNGKPEAYGWRK